MMEFVDSHAHLTYEPFEGRLDQILDQAALVGVTRILTIGTDCMDSLRAVAIAKEYENRIFASIGVHPHEAKDYSPADIDDMSRIIEDGSVVAVGETGLDYHYEHSPRDRQRAIFEAQLQLARRYSIPAIIHCRDAFDDCLSILANFQPEPGKVIIHCYSGNVDQARTLLDMGVLLSFSGTVTYKKSEDIQASAKFAPLDRILVETDCPYLSPEPKRSIKPNEPALVVHTAWKIAELKQVALEEIAAATTANFTRCFLDNKPMFI
ncbi:MAG: TatD family hydrolase [Sedimentisphaerales bacterium]|nr:TatD family hydrolase [Sedimentisphaerales bacterium]